MNYIFAMPCLVSLNEIAVDTFKIVYVQILLFYDQCLHLVGSRSFRDMAFKAWSDHLHMAVYIFIFIE